MLAKLLTTVTSHAKIALAAAAGAALVAGGSAVAITQVADSKPSSGATVTAPLAVPDHPGRARADNEPARDNALADNEKESDTPTATISPKPTRSPDADNETPKPSKSPEAADCNHDSAVSTVAQNSNACVKKTDDGNDNEKDATESPRPSRSPHADDANENENDGNGKDANESESPKPSSSPHAEDATPEPAEPGGSGHGGGSGHDGGSGHGGS